MKTYNLVVNDDPDENPLVAAFAALLDLVGGTAVLKNVDSYYKRTMTVSFTEGEGVTFRLISDEEMAK